MGRSENSNDRNIILCTYIHIIRAYISKVSRRVRRRLSYLFLCGSIAMISYDLIFFRSLSAAVLHNDNITRTEAHNIIVSAAIIVIITIIKIITIARKGYTQPRRRHNIYLKQYDTQ